ncbi:MAG: hypothetical protein IPK13_04305 [Deltaproteobacteria bacterium]|nr:hypothetical protein [Deltaproteobacteria bacterium]
MHSEPIPTDASHRMYRFVAGVGVVSLLLLVTFGTIDWWIGLIASVVIVAIELSSRRFFPNNKFVRNLTLVGAMIGLQMFSAEVFCRAFLAQAIYYRPHEMLAQRHPKIENLTRYAPNRTVEFKQTFGDLASMVGDPARRDLRDIVFTTDEWGLRNDPGDSTEPIQLAILGDSFVVGNGTTQEATWGRLMRTRHHVATYNLGMPGSPWVTYAHLVEMADRLKFTSDAVWVLVLFSGNDLEGGYLSPKLSRIDQTRWDQYMVWRRKSVVRNLINRSIDQPAASTKVFFDEKLGHLLYSPYVVAYKRTTQQAHDHPNFSRMIRTIGNIQTLADKHHVRFRVVVLPSKEEMLLGDLSTPSGFVSALLPECSAKNWSCTDLKPLMVAADSTSEGRPWRDLWWRDDTHINAAGHSALTDIVYSIVKQDRGIRSASRF